MGFSDAVSSCLGKYATFSGRAPRSEYWWFFLFNFLASIVVDILFAIIGYFVAGQGLQGIIGAQVAILVGSILLFFTLFIPSLAVTIRRLHDTNHSGGWYFISFIPLAGSIWFLILMLTGSDEENEYGLPVY